MKFLKNFLSRGKKHIDEVEYERGQLLELKKLLEQTKALYAESLGVMLRLRREADSFNNQSDEYKKKASLLEQRAVDGELDRDQANRLKAEFLDQSSISMSKYEEKLQEIKSDEILFNKLKEKIAILQKEVYLSQRNMEVRRRENKFLSIENEIKKILFYNRENHEYMVGNVEVKDHSYYTEEDKNDIKELINKIQIDSEGITQLSKDTKKLINENLSYLYDALDRVNKTDWRGIAISAPINISIKCSLDIEENEIVLSLFKAIFEK